MKVKSDLRLGSIVRLPSGNKGQVKAIKIEFKPKVPIDVFGWIEERATLVVAMKNGRKVSIADYQCEFVSGMPESAG